MGFCQLHNKLRYKLIDARVTFFTLYENFSQFTESTDV